jgi:hypothetical protein
MLEVVLLRLYSAQYCRHWACVAPLAFSFLKNISLSGSRGGGAFLVALLGACFPHLQFTGQLGIL